MVYRSDIYTKIFFLIDCTREGICPKHNELTAIKKKFCSTCTFVNTNIHQQIDFKAFTN